MDPNANLAEQEWILAELARVAAADVGTEPLIARLTDLREALVGWMAAGGFQPMWTSAPHASVYFASRASGAVQDARVILGP